ncbi:MAG: 4Fe-4S cluster-binding domain-containing protein [Deltaproteobacteria bacterium]|nr:4Fe-4S cluster-binding domain-containing protein [Deltaproteobacteria bacterium]
MSANRSVRLAHNIIDRPKLDLPAAGQFAINEIFCSLQGEGAQAGRAMVFLRFSQCNLRCSVSNSGFDCDTDFSGKRVMTQSQIFSELSAMKLQTDWLLLTGGEPALQVTPDFLGALKNAGWKIAIETNGTIRLPEGFDWITLSPKSAEHTIRQRHADEVKYVLSEGMSLPRPSIAAKHYFVSPAFQPDGTLRREDLEWCINLVKQAPDKWRLSIQLHKLIGIR